MQLLIPANSQLLISVISGFVTLDPFDTSLLTATYYTPPDVEMNNKLEQLDYESASCIVNLGSCLYFILGQISIVILEALFLALFRLKCWHGRSHNTSVRADKCRRWFEKQPKCVYLKKQPKCVKLKNHSNVLN